MKRCFSILAGCKNTKQDESIRRGEIKTAKINEVEITTAKINRVGIGTRTDE